jgi:hypothetical protein
MWPWCKRPGGEKRYEIVACLISEYSEFSSPKGFYVEGLFCCLPMKRPEQPVKLILSNAQPPKARV